MVDKKQQLESIDSQIWTTCEVDFDLFIFWELVIELRPSEM